MQVTTMLALLTALLQRDRMKTLTLTEPWCSLVACGAKRIETRSWRTDYRGPLALHAAKTLPEHIDALCGQSAFREVLQQEHARESGWQFPTGQILAVALLDEVVSTHQVHPEERERDFGNFAPGRYAWLFSAVYRLPTPVPVRGSPGLWDWQPPAAFWLDVQAAFDRERQVARG